MATTNTRHPDAITVTRGRARGWLTVTIGGRQRIAAVRDAAAHLLADSDELRVTHHILAQVLSDMRHGDDRWGDPTAALLHCDGTPYDDGDVDW
jgi:hypothetical protein